MKAFLLDADPVAKNGKSGVRLFVKTIPQGKSSRLFVPFEPYFYLLPRDMQVAEKGVPAAKAFSRGGQCSVKRVEKIERIVAGKPAQLLKVFAHAPVDVPSIRDVCRQWGQTMEDNIPFARRFVIDSGLVPCAPAEFRLAQDGVTVEEFKPIEKGLHAFPPISTMAFDIETYNPLGVPNPKTDSCLMISYATPAGQNAKASSGVLTYSKDAAASKFAHATLFENEKEMIEGFAALVREKKVDLLSGYNSDEFDLPYLIERSKALKFDLRLGRDRKPINLRKLGLRRRARVSGRIHFDAFVPASFFNFIGAYKFPRLTLGAVYHEISGEEKIDTKKTEIWKAWDEGGAKLSHLLHYSEADAKACLQVTERFLPLEVELSKVTRMPLFEISRSTPGQMVESLLMRSAFERGEIVPDKPGFSTVQSRQNDAIKGAYVKMPSPGLYENLVVFDFRSLYPTIITAHNIDPFTLNCSCCAPEANVAPTGVRFCQKNKGLIPETLGRVLKERFAIIDEMKKIGKDGKESEEYRQLDARKFALKILANSFYGYLVYSRSRYYSRESGEATTAWARQYIQDTIKMAEGEGFQVLYSDSVTAERCIPYLDEAGVMRVEPVEDIFSKYSSKGVVQSGEKEVVLSPGIRVLSADPLTGEPRWSKANEIIRHLNTKRVYRVRQKYGETRVTEDHSLIVRVEGRLQARKPRELGGDSLAALRSIPPVKGIQQIDLLDWLGDYSHERIYKGRRKVSSLKAAGERGEKISFAWMQRRSKPFVNRFFDVGSPQLLSLCRLLGAYIAEGSSSTPETTSSRWGASIASGSEFWLKQLQSDFVQVFGNAKAGIIASMKGERTLQYSDRQGLAHVSVYNDETLKLQMMNQISAVVFRQLCGQKSTKKRLPDFIFHLPDDCKLALLKNMIYGDGSTEFGPRYSQDYRVNNFRYTTRSLQLASGLCVLLSQLGQNYSLRRDIAKDSYELATCDSSNSRLGTRISQEAYAGFVYDFSVEGSKMFADSCGNILLHNTDSCFMLLGDKTKADAMAFQKKVNDSLPGTMEFELEDYYPRGIFVSKKQGEAGAKKKYALINSKGAIKIRGFELVRRDWSGIARKTQREVLEILLKEGDLDKAKALVRAKFVALKEGKVDKADLVISTQLRKSTGGYEVKSPELGAVQKARAAGHKVEEHSLVEYIITKQGKTISEKAELAEFAKQGDYDVDYYLNNQLMPAVLKILGALGVDEGDLKQKGRQKGLGDWG